MKNLSLKRTQVFLVEYVMCLLFTMGYLSAGQKDVLWVPVMWLTAHLGPLFWLLGDTIHNLQDWLWWSVTVVTNILCISAYLVYPNRITGLISFLGIAGWFYLAVFAMQMGI